MSDHLVQFQEWVAQYPTWMVAGAIGFAVVVVVVVFWKAMKLAVTALIVAIVFAGGWYIWEKVSARDQPAVRPAAEQPLGARP